MTKHATEWTGFQEELYELAKSKPYWTLAEIEDYCQRFGSHWFSKDTLRFFRSRISDIVHCGPGGVFFVSSERCTWGDGYARAYSVRQFNPEGAADPNVNLIDEGPGCVFQQFKSGHGAHNKAARLAAGKAQP
jgi:hypothetical protein